MKYSPAGGPRKDTASKVGDRYIPELEGVAAVRDGHWETYSRRLQQYFISGIKTGEVLPQTVHPIKYAPYLTGEKPWTDFPVFHDSRNDEIIPLYALLDKWVNEQFDGEASAILRKELPVIFAAIQKTWRESGRELVLKDQAEALFEALHKLGIPQTDPEVLEQRINAILNELFERAGLLFGFRGNAVFEILSLQNRNRNHLKSTFLAALTSTLSGLQDWLALESDESGRSIGKLDFAEDLISLDKIRDMAISSVSSHLPPSRLKRLRSALQTLVAARESYARSSLTIYTTEEIASSCKLRETFPDARFVPTSGDPCEQAWRQARQDLEKFVPTIAALRMGKRMIEQTNEDQLHDPYFDRFDRTFLTEDEWQYLPPILVIQDSRQLMRQSGFLALLGKNSFVKVLGINRLEDLFDLPGQEDPRYLELASLALFQRSSYVFQGSLHRPSKLSGAIKKGLAYPGAAFWNVLIPGRKGESARGYYSLVAAVESRFFPGLEYEAQGDPFSGDQIDLRDNPAPEAYAAGYEQEIRSPEGVESRVLNLTIAEFLAMDPDRQETLEIIPPAYQSPNCIPLNEHLTQPKDLGPGKVPFVWLVDDQFKLRRAAVPVSWIQTCRSRREYWAFLQSISGIKDARLQETLDAARSEWERAREDEIEALQSKLQDQHEKDRAADLQRAVVRILNGLLDEEGNLEKVLTEAGRPAHIPEGSTEADAPPAPEPPAGEPVKEAPEEEEAEPSAPPAGEVWVESEECTSCRDCIDALPSVFKYDENKQAFVHNPKGGTYAQIVKAAEKCPARCIHPGAPQNKDEKDLDKWIQRAEKFN